MSTQLPSPDRIDWPSVWEAFGCEPTEALSSLHTAGFAIENYLDQDVKGEEIVADAIDTGALYRDDGIRISGFEASNEDTEEQEDTEEEKTEDLDEPSEMERSELEQEVRDLRSNQQEMRAMFEAMNKKINGINQVLVGSDGLSDVVEPGQATPVWTRLDDMSSSVEEHDAKMEMFSTESGKSRKPDERAVRIRQVLFEDAKRGKDNAAAMSRDGANKALGGGLSRAQTISAMRRAANGKDADIDGSCDLENMDGVEFHVGKGKDRQSSIRMDLENATGMQVRKNFTTEKTAEGGS